MQNGESVLLHGADVKSLLEEPLQVKKKIATRGNNNFPHVLAYLVFMCSVALCCFVFCYRFVLVCWGGGGLLLS